MPTPKWEDTEEVIPSWDDTKPADEIPEYVSAYRGALQGASLGFGDELAGALESVGGVFGLSGVGTKPIVEIGYETPEEKTKSIVERYRAGRDEMRRKNEMYSRANPKSYMAGELVGGAAIPIGSGLSTAKTIGQAVKTGAKIGAATGALSGYGANVKDEDLVKDITKGAVVGGLTGAGGGALGYGISKGISAIKGKDVKADAPLVKDPTIKENISALKEDFYRGANLGEEKAWPFLKTPQKILGGIKEALKSSKATESFKKMILDSKMLSLSRMVPEGEGNPNALMHAKSMLSKMGDDDYIIWALNNGDPDVIKWVSQNAAGEGLNFQSSQLEELLSIPPARRMELRNYDITNKAREIEPLARQASEDVTKSYSGRFGELSEEAKNKFGTELEDKGKLFDVFFGQKEALSKSGSLHTSKAAKPFLEDASNILYGNTEHYGFSKGLGFDQIDPSEQFMRLQKAREIIDDGIDYAALKMRKPTESERILLEQKNKLSAVLKSLDSKAEADRVYSVGKKIDEMVFGKTEFKGGVDPYKIKRLLGNSDDANRFRDGLSYLRDWADKSNDPIAKETAQKFLNKFDEVFKEYALNQKITSANFRGGATSQAVERLGSRLKKDDLVTEAIQSPVNFMKRQENQLKNFMEVLNLPEWKRLSHEDQLGLTRLMVWAKKQDSGISPEAIKKNFEIFKKMK